MRRMAFVCLLLVCSTTTFASQRAAKPNNPPPDSVDYSSVPRKCIESAPTPVTSGEWTYTCEPVTGGDQIVLHYTGHYSKPVFRARRERTTTTAEKMGFVVAQDESLTGDTPPPPLLDEYRVAKVYQGEVTEPKPAWKYKRDK